MAITAVRKADGNFEVFQDGQRISTTSAGGLVSFGLSRENLGAGTKPPLSAAPTPTPRLPAQPTPQPPGGGFRFAQSPGKNFAIENGILFDVGSTTDLGAFKQRFGDAGTVSTSFDRLAGAAGGRFATSAEQTAFNQRTAAPSPVSVTSSQAGLEKSQQNVDQLTKIEQALALAREQVLAIEANVKPLVEAQKGGLETTGQTTVQEAQKFLNLGGTASGQATVDSINNAPSDARDPDAERRLKDEEAAATAALTAARNAADSGDPIGLDAAMKSFRERKEILEQNLIDYLTEVNKRRAERDALAVPSERSKILQKQALDIKTEIDQISLENERRKFSEFEGQTVGFARGRGAEFDIRTGFETQERRLALQNVLSELGLEQGGQELALKSAQQAIDDFQSDFELIQEVNTKIFDAEQDVLDKVDTLRDDSKDDLFNILDELGDINPTELSEASRAQIEDLARKSGIDSSIIFDALAATHARNVFDDSIKTEKERTAEEKSAREERRVDLEARRVAVVEAKEERLASAEAEDEINNPGDYTDLELRKLRGFGINVTDIELADTFLYQGEAEAKALQQQREKGLSPSSFEGLTDFLKKAGETVFSFIVD